MQGVLFNPCELSGDAPSCCSRKVTTHALADFPHVFIPCGSPAKSLTAGHMRLRSPSGTPALTFVWEYSIWPARSHHSFATCMCCPRKAPLPQQAYGRAPSLGLIGRTWSQPWPASALQMTPQKYPLRLAQCRSCTHDGESCAKVIKVPDIRIHIIYVIYQPKWCQPLTICIDYPDILQRCSWCITLLI